MLVLDQLRRGDRPLQLLAVTVLLGLAVLLVGLWNVQVRSAKRYEADLRTQQFRTVRVPAIRGKILDASRQPLAVSRPNHTLHLYLEELTAHFRRTYSETVKPGYLLRHPGTKPARPVVEELERYARYLVVSNIVQQVATLLGEAVPLDERRFHKHYLTQRALPYVLLDNLSPGQVARFVESGSDVPGVELEIQPLRSYPHGTLAAHLLGHLRRDDDPENDEGDGFNYRLPDYRGETGLEGLFETELRGRAGVRSILVNNLNYRKSVQEWARPEPGRNLILTLDLGLQRAVEEALRAVGAEVRGAVVVLNARNGDLLALQSAPGYDPNEFIRGITPDSWVALNDPKFRPLFNRTLHGAYHPGSIFKIVTGLACLENGLDPESIYRVEPDPQRPGRGCIHVGRRKIEDTADPGDYDFRRAFLKSSNAYFIHHGLNTGLEKLLRMGHAFHLGQPAGLLPRQEAAGYFPEPAEVAGSWSAGNVANVCIGQEITVTPVQMAVMTAAIANGGRVFRPRLVVGLETDDPDGARLELRPPAEVVGDLPVQPRHLEIIRAAMLADVENPEGTGRSARVEGMQVCGKTGTAQVTQGRRVIDHTTWFASFAPYDNPRYVVVVMVESGGSGGGTCGPVARRIYEFLKQRDSRPGNGALAASL